MEDKKSKCNSKSNSQYGGPSLRSRMTAKNKQQQQQKQRQRQFVVRFVVCFYALVLF